MNNTKFGSPGRFEIELGWIKDREAREHRPAHGGWSTGELKITVGGHVLTRNRRAGKDRDSVQWYLLPVFEWLVKNWTPLFHEENYSWHENDAGPAATSTFMAMRRLIAAEDDINQEKYEKVQSWWQRHALRAADSSALYPDVYFRRLGNDIEISWTARQPTYAPDGFRFSLMPGVATLPIAEVTEPLWQSLEWFVKSSEVADVADIKTVEQLRQRLNELHEISTKDLESWYLPERLLKRIDEVKKKFAIATESARLPSVPAISFFDSPVLMFGGVSPDIGDKDVETLLAFLSSHFGGTESAALTELVDTSIGAPIAAPFEEGYDLAEDLLEQLDLPGNGSFIDIADILTKLGIEIKKQKLHTHSIRGVALAGSQYSPAILVNTKFSFNETKVGQRFTLAHEFFHILYDRTRAKRVTHTSGPWASPGVEKRANAFAAMLLMPRELIRKSVIEKDINSISNAAASMRVGITTLIEHLYNLNVIDEMEREGLAKRD
ncbi:ImmA/IrrE family metallo-endopeptidase [uncultured Thiodictyon sp.]|jgi:Zn-dependent peptidase ImmA (M78 family)|uniref:ImmA/IrrE family metallo-endopeptidase n=1 Tax=uncultured Thiodictyon sp. TaxID=1846217 RepID=UPI0025D41C66|nr:ImmA/IrrE family metallo-endopeptidase [uncultured Thiodictyon sp.]